MHLVKQLWTVGRYQPYSCRLTKNELSSDLLQANIDKNILKRSKDCREVTVGMIYQ